jgi:hypothetical protein
MTAIAKEFRVSREGATVYRITGVVSTTKDGWGLVLGPDNEGINPSPDRAVFRLAAVEPEFGPDVLVDESVDHQFRDSAELRTVELRLKGLLTAEGLGHMTLEVPV